MLRSSPRRQPALCLASAIVSVGALLGRRVQTPTGLRTNVYALGIAETASGKGVGIKLPTRLFVAAGGGTLTHAAALLLAIGAGLLTLLLAARLLRIEEFETLSAEARSKVGKLLSR